MFKRFYKYIGDFFRLNAQHNSLEAIKSKARYQFSFLIIVIFSIGVLIGLYNGLYMQAFTGFFTVVLGILLPFSTYKKWEGILLISISFTSAATIYVADVCETEHAHNMVFYIILFFAIPFYVHNAAHKIVYFICLAVPVLFFTLSITETRLFTCPIQLTEQEIKASSYLNYSLVILIVWLFATLFKNSIAALTTALEKENEILSQIFNNTSDAIFLMDAKTAVIHDCNQRATDLFEAKNKQQLIGMDGRLLEHQPMSNTDLKNILADIASKGFYKHVSIMRTLNGRPFWGDKAATYLKRHDKDCIKVRVADVSGYIQAIDKAEESEAYLQALIDKPSMYIWSIDKNICLLNFNSIFAKNIASTYGIEVKKGISAIDFLDSAHHAYWKQMYEKALNGERFSDNWQFGNRTYEIDFTPLIIKDKIFGVSVVAQDVTRRIKLEKKLIEAREKAIVATKAKEQFLSNISHDLRTPLNSMLGITHVLMNSAANSTQAEQLQILQFSIKNMYDLVNDVLDIQKIESNNLSIVYEELNLKSFLKNTIQLHQFSAQQKQLYLHLHIQESVPEVVYTDSLRLTQIFNNLINNAVKFTQSGGVTVHVSTFNQSNNSKHLLFKVADTGIGIAEDKLQKLFTPYTQADTTIERKFGGTGLGLAITQKLVHALGGSITVESKQGRGTTFELILPFEDRNLTTVKLPNMQQSPLDHFVLVGKRVLLVDDSPFNVYVAKQFLESWEMVVEIALSGLSAIQKVKESYFDIILMDLQMPEMDGVEAANIIKSIHNEVKIVALTAYAEDELVNKIELSVMDDYLVKPFMPDMFKTKICNLLSEKPMP